MHEVTTDVANLAVHAFSLRTTSTIGSTILLDLTILALGAHLALAVSWALGGAARGSARYAVLLIPVFYLVGVAQLVVSPQSDTLGYYSTARALSGAGGRLVETVQVSGKDGYVRLLSLVFRAGEPSMSTPVAVNAVLLAMTIAVLVRLTEELAGAEAAQRVPAVVAFAPPLVIWGTQGLREAGIYLGIALVMLFVLLMSKAPSPSRLLGLSASLYLLFNFRAAIAAVVLAGCLMALFLSARRLGRVAALVVGLSAVILWIAVLPRVGFFAQLQGAYFDSSRIEVVRSSLATANSGFVTDFTTPSGILVALARTIAGPFPWEWPTYPQALPDVLFWMAAAVASTRAARVSSKTAKYFCLVVWACILLAVATGVTNYGMLLRVRAMGVIPLVPLLAVWLELARGPSRQRRREQEEDGMSAVR